jgi:hypothetical protein
MKPHTARSFRPHLEWLERRELPAGGLATALATNPLTGNASSTSLLGPPTLAQELGPIFQSPQTLSATLNSLGPTGQQLDRKFTNLPTEQQNLTVQIFSSQLTTPATLPGYALIMLTGPVGIGVQGTDTTVINLFIDQQKLTRDILTHQSSSTISADYAKANSDFTQVESEHTNLQDTVKKQQQVEALAVASGQLNATDDLMAQFAFNQLGTHSSSADNALTIANEIINTPEPLGFPSIAAHGP